MRQEKMKYLLEVEDLKTYFYTSKGVIRAVDGVSFKIQQGEVMGIVGESGCGKSLTALSILRLISSTGKIVGGRILFQGIDLLSLDVNQMQHIRGNDIAMISQEPMTSLNPAFTIGDQIGEAIMLHQNLHNKKDILKKTVKILKEVGIPRAQEIVKEFPFNLSGGMCQRVMIAMALSCKPLLLIADEPTTALDVTIQAQILDLMKKLRKKLNTSIIFITHDLSVVAEMADHVVVIYAGKVVEDARVCSLYQEPLHPYTRGLLSSHPKIEEERNKLDFIPGIVPNPLDMPCGCIFHPRCQQAMKICREREPELRDVYPGHKVSCWLYHKENERSG
ncbi:MAG: ABC transporter ATP-binding protein [Promethearchaeota archaeon]